MRIALVHDSLVNKGGAERVLLNMHKAFPNAPIYTSVYNQQKSYQEFKNCDIRTSWLQSLTKNEKIYKNTFPFIGVHVMQSHDLSKYDVILSSTTHCAKYIKTGDKNFVINYCYTPFRLAWNPNSYQRYEDSKGINKFVFNKIIANLKKIDFKYAQRANKYIAMTPETSNRIKKHYQIIDEIEIINPSIDTGNYYISNKTNDYYLIVSRLEKYKMVDLAIHAFNKTGKPLKIIGCGMEENRLKNIANDNIEFVGSVSQYELVKVYSKCKALIFPQYEDYGLTPLEANACGRPVIAYGHGGIRSTMIPHKSNSSGLDFTAVFFNNQNLVSLIEAIDYFENLKVDKNFIRKHAEKFDDQIFIKKLRSFVETEFVNFTNNTNNKFK